MCVSAAACNFGERWTHDASFAVSFSEDSDGLKVAAGADFSTSLGVKRDKKVLLYNLLPLFHKLS